MKYFTKEWCFSNLDDREIKKRWNAYKKYIDGIYERLPYVLKILARHLNLHDGRVKNVNFYKNKSVLNINGVFGDQQVGYFFLDIKYFDVSNLNDNKIKSIFNSIKVEVLSDEIEFLTENLFSHRILFSTKQDIDIQFRDVEISISSAFYKDYEKGLCKFKSGL